VNSKVRHTPLLPVDREGFHRLSSGHPWLFRGNLTQEFFKTAKQPGLYPLGEHWFFYSTHSDISLRRFGPTERLWPGLPESERHPIVDIQKFEALFGGWIELQLKNTLHRKRVLLSGEKCFRWIFSEADLLPGLIVDVFENDLACQIQTEPMELFWPVIKKLITRVLESELKLAPVIHELRRSKSRLKEGLPVVDEPQASADRARWINWNGINWWMNPGLGQKTGAYFDQKDNHLAAAAWAKTLGYKEAWDLCCYHGGFGLQLAKQGLNVLAVDDSEAALETARKNAVENKISGFATEKSDVFEFLRSRYDQHAKTELIMLDPPGVSGAKKNLPSALRGLKELNLRAMHCLKPGGMLVTCTCSHAISDELLTDVVRQAAHDVRRHLRVVEKRGPAPDHAPIIGFPESEYLRAWYLVIE
jgi:23S rRNA (cytosine1962-C5)-methyltransferase